MTMPSGKIYLVGAGPGDPGLITVRGREVLEHADIVFYDSLANDALLAYAARAEHVFAGKSTDRHTLTQDEINRLLVEHAKQGKRVVRLKGGDPFVFGRGGEEALYAAAHEVPIEVVPGVTAGLAAPSFAGIPVTHRGLSTSVTLITGHDEQALETGETDLGKIALQGTLAFYMSVKSLPLIARQLLSLGRSPDTPVAVIIWATYPKQRTIVGTLGTIVEQCRRESVAPPALAVVGDVVQLHGQLSWFESRPLFGKRIVVTRARAQSADLVRQLHELGADVLEFPTIEIEPARMDESFDDIGRYDWIVLTSVNAVEMLFEQLEEQGHDARDLAGVKLCVIGAATAEAVRKRFLRVDLMPERYIAEDLMAALQEREGPLSGKRFLMPRADIARSFLPAELRKHGAEVKELVAYRTVPPRTTEDRANALLAYKPDLVTFTSSSTARNFFDILGPDRVKRIRETAAFASLGPITTKTANDLGMPVRIEPHVHDIPHFVEAIVQGMAAPEVAG